MSHLSKVHAEKLLEMYATLHGLRALSLRFGIVHGLGPIFKTDPRFMTAPNLFCWRAARGALSQEPDSYAATSSRHSNRHKKSRGIERSHSR